MRNNREYQYDKGEPCALRDASTVLGRGLRKPTSETMQGGALPLYYGTSGIPDIICCYKGRFLGLEAKLPGGRLTELQKRALDKINRAGGIARRVESVEDARAVIRQADEERRSI